MNIRGQTYGFALLMVLALIILTSFATIDIWKESLDDVRAGDTLNCPGVTDFNQTQYDEDSDFNRLVRRPTCFVTGVSMVYFIGTVIIASSIWVVRNWNKR